MRPHHVQAEALDLQNKSVSVVGRRGVVVVYALGSTIPLAAFGGPDLAVDEIFAEA